MPHPRASIFYLGRNDLDGTLTFSINGVRWEYWLHRADLESLDYIAKRWITKGLANAKRRAYRSEKQA